MGWFTGRRLKKIARTVAFMSALSTACAQKSDDFMDLVTEGDRDHAAQLFNDPTRKKDWLRALAAIDKIKNSAEYNNLLGPSISGKEILENSDFLDALEDYFSVRFYRKKYYEAVQEQLMAVRIVGLENTAKELEKRLLNYYLTLDRLFAENINDGVNRDLEKLNKLPPPKLILEKKWLKERQSMRIINRVLGKARDAEFGETVNALLNAADRLEAFLGK